MIFLNGFRRFEDESISAGGKFIYRMSEEDWCVCCTMVPIPYILKANSQGPYKSKSLFGTLQNSPISVNY